MRQHAIVFAFSLFSCLLIVPTIATAGPRVDIVIGEKAPALGRLAADELAGQLKRLYEADAKIAATAPADSPHVIFVGNPDTNASMKQFTGSWPSGEKKLTEQGHLLRSVIHNNKPALLIGGGSPVATYWAVAEFGHRLGIRSMLFGDLDPVAPPAFTLEGHDLVIEPSPRHRGLHFEQWCHADSDSWGTDEFRAVFRQLAKLRFNHVTLQPFAHIEYAGITQSTNDFVRTPIEVSGDTLGRKAFGGAKLFGNPSFVGADNYTKRRAAGEKHLRAVIGAAQEFGMRVTLRISVRRFPAEFAKHWPEVAAKLEPNATHFLFLSELPTTDAKFAGLLRVSVRAVIETYPTLNGLQVDDALKSRNDSKVLGKFFSQPGLLQRPDGNDVPVAIRDLSDEESVMFAPFVGMSPKTKPVALVEYHLSARNTLPCFLPRKWEKSWVQATPLGGFDVALRTGIGEYDLPTYWLSRRSCGQTLSPREACRELLAPVCGEEVDHRVWRAIELAQEAIDALDEHNAEIGIPYVQPILEIAEAPPAAWNSARDGFLNAMNEMYRANTRAREGGRAFTLYLARRFEFAFEYMNYVEAARNSAVAERTAGRDAQAAQIEKAIESLNNALNAMAAVARSSSDRGVIAELNEHGYRPLKKKLAEAEAK